MPALRKEDGTLMGESIEIAKHICQQYGLYPQDAAGVAAADKATADWDDVISKLYQPLFAKDEDKPAMYAEIFGTHVPPFLVKYEAHFANGGFVSGDELSFADFFIGGLYTNMFNNPICFEPEQWKTLMD